MDGVTFLKKRILSCLVDRLCMVKFKLFSIIFLLILSKPFFSQSDDCKQYKIGRFESYDNIIGKTIIIRDEDKQTEYNEKWSSIIELEIEWITNCSYRLKLIDVIKNPQRIEFSKEQVLTVHIIKTNNQSCIQEVFSNELDFSFRTEMFISN